MEANRCLCLQQPPKRVPAGRRPGAASSAAAVSMPARRLPRLLDRMADLPIMPLSAARPVGALPAFKRSRVVSIPPGAFGEPHSRRGTITGHLPSHRSWAYAPIPPAHRGTRPPRRNRKFREIGRRKERRRREQAIAKAQAALDEAKGDHDAKAGTIKAERAAV